MTCGGSGRESRPNQSRGSCRPGTQSSGILLHRSHAQFSSTMHRNAALGRERLTARRAPLWCSTAAVDRYKRRIDELQVQQISLENDDNECAVFDVDSLVEACKPKTDRNGGHIYSDGHISLMQVLRPLTKPPLGEPLETQPQNTRSRPSENRHKVVLRTHKALLRTLTVFFFHRVLQNIVSVCPSVGGAILSEVVMLGNLTTLYCAAEAGFGRPPDAEEREELAEVTHTAAAHAPHTHRTRTAHATPPPPHPCTAGRGRDDSERADLAKTEERGGLLALEIRGGVILAPQSSTAVGNPRLCRFAG